MSGLSAQQLEIRRTRIGSSEIGAIVDFYAESGAPRCDPYKTAQSVFNEKVLPRQADEQEARHQRWGIIKEPAILEFHAEEHAMELVAPMVLFPDSHNRWPTLVHPKHPICATPDGIGEKFAKQTLRDVQAKNVQEWSHLRWGSPGTDDAPLVYVGQIQIELGILLQHEKFAGRIEDVGDLAVSLAGAPPVAYNIKFDPELFGGLITLAAKFKRDYLDTGKPPQLDGSDAASEFVRRRWEKHVGAMKPRTDVTAALVESIRSRKADIKADESALEAAANELKHLIGGAAGIEGLCTWKKAKDSAEVITDWKSVAEDTALAHVLSTVSTTPKGLDDAAAFLAAFIDKHTAAKVTKKGSRRLLLLKSNGTNEEEEEKNE